MVRLTSDYAGYRTREAASVAANLKRRLIQNTGKPIPTGLTMLDRHLGGGLVPSTMIGIGAFTKTGKTTLLNTISYNLEEGGHSHLIFTLERREEDVEAAKASRFLECSSRKLASRVNDLDRYIARPRRAYYIHDTQITVEDIRHEILYHKRRYGIIMAGVDYWQLIQPSSKERRDSNRERELARAAQVLQQTAMDADLCIVITCQLSDDGRPRESNSIKFASSLYVNMHRDQGRAETWFETTATNITPWTNIGSINTPALLFEGEIGPYFRNPED
nr:DnaB-like helicase C-terminal domain-containing protein [Microvirga tunisiensis]